MRRIGGWILSAAILLFLGRTLLSSWDQVASSGVTIKFDLPLLVASLVLLVIGRAFGVEAWRRILAALGQPITFRFAFYAWFISNLARYVPGNIWQVATMMVLVERAGVSKMNALLSQAVYTAIALSVTALFGLTLLPIAKSYLPLAGLLFLALIILFALPPVFKLLIAITRRGTELVRRGQVEAAAIPPPTFARGLIPPVCSCAMWAINGLAFYLFMRSLTDIPISLLPAFAAINAAAYFVGYVSFVTPSGLGFREGAMALLLAPYFPTPLAVAIAFLTRIWSTAGELLAVGLAAWGMPRGADKSPAHQERADSTPVPQ